jgi:PadR family transcriptional regulator, regulatory protein PadR
LGLGAWGLWNPRRLGVVMPTLKAKEVVGRPPVYLGEFEQLVLLAILHLGDAAYAVPIRQELATRARRDIARGALYTTLERLESKGYVRSRFGEPVPERGGRPRRYFVVTARGIGTLKTSREALRGMYQGLEAIFGETL